MAEDSELESSDASGAEFRVHLCYGPNCTERGSRRLMPILERAIRDAGLEDRVEVLATTCRNRCDEGPSLNVYPGPVFYNQLDADGIVEIVARHLASGELATEWLYRPRIESSRRRKSIAGSVEP